MDNPRILFFSDFDGTIVDIESYEIYPLLSKLLRKYRENIDFVLATGRNWEGLEQYSDKLALHLPQIIGNGGAIIEPLTKEVIWSAPIELPILVQLNEYVVKDKRVKAISSVSPTETFDEIVLRSDIIRISLVIKERDYDHVIKELETSYLASDLSWVTLDSREADKIIDLTARKINKFTGIKKWLTKALPQSLYKYRQIYFAGNNNSDLIVFDKYFSKNDIVLLAPSDAVPEVKAKARVIIPSPKEHGFYSFLSTQMKELGVTHAR